MTNDIRTAAQAVVDADKKSLADLFLAVDALAAALAQPEPAPNRLVSNLVHAACLQEREPSEANQNAYRAARDAVEAALAAPRPQPEPAPTPAAQPVGWREALQDALEFIEYYSRHWNGVSAKHPNTIAKQARALLAPSASVAVAKIVNGNLAWNLPQPTDSVPLELLRGEYPLYTHPAPPASASTASLSEREAFEAWAATYMSDPGKRDPAFPEGYTNIETSIAWHAWRARGQKKTASQEAASGEPGAHARLGMARFNDTCKHEFAVQPSSGIGICIHCGLSEVAAWKCAALASPTPTPAPEARKPLTEEQVWRDDDLMEANAIAGLPLDQFLVVVRAVEGAHGIQHPADGAEGGKA